MVVDTRVEKRYLIQFCANKVWRDVDCDFNGKWIKSFSMFEGNKFKPTIEELERAKKAESNFSDNLFRVVEKTIIILEESDKTRVR